MVKILLRVGLAASSLVWMATPPMAMAQSSGASSSKPAQSSDPAIVMLPADRQALIALYKATDGDDWTNHAGWLGAPGTECKWYGVECETSNDGKMRVVELSLDQNNLSGTIPGDLGQLSGLSSLDLGQNHLRGPIPPALGNLKNLEWFDLFGNNLSGLVPHPLPEKWLAGPLHISAETHLLTDVSEIDFESSASALLCGRYRYILRNDDSVTTYAVRCRNATPDDRLTFCEVKEGSALWGEFARLALFIDNEHFFDLAAKYDMSMTDGTFDNIRVTKNGTSHAVSNYNYAGPFALWIIQQAIVGVASSSEWSKTSTQQDCPRW